MRDMHRTIIGLLICVAASILPLPSLTVVAASTSTYKMDELPGICQYSDSFSQRLTDEFTSKKGVYEVRTEFLFDDGNPRFINRLIFENSPYLLQHAHNPVNWYAWGGEAFETAKRENKPIFLSIGYATCHWVPRDGKGEF